MCGIVGAVSARPVDVALIEGMRDQLAHRGPDHAGVWRSQDGRVCLGHRRLAILDLTAEANQPFVSGDRRFVVTFNGEIYNHARLRRELIDMGARFRTRSDTEVLVEAYAQWGKGCLSRLAGMFAFAIWDRLDRRLFCARDRVGEKPFHYCTVGNSFLFASELKALLHWPGFRREVSQRAVIDFLSLGFVPDPACIWEGCRKLPPGHHLTIDLVDGSPRVGEPVRWWDMTFEPDRTVDDWGPAIRETLQWAASEMALADVPVGTFLSGGVDSSSVTAALARSGGAPRTFTIGFGDRDYDERPWARQVAEIYGTEHRERLVAPGDVTAVLDRLHWHFDEPLNDYSYLPTYYVCRDARQDVTVALSGDGGDESFAGYRKYRRLALRSAVEPLLPAFASAGMARAATALSGRSRVGTLLREYGGDASLVLAGTMITGLDRAALRNAARGPLRAALAEHAVEDTVTALLERVPPGEVGLVNAMRYLDLKLTLAGGILVKLDRASMAVSLEVRPVHLHPELLALAGRIPPERLARRGEAKEALKSAMRPWLPDSVLYRPKAGFAMPLGRWLRDGLRHLATGEHHGSDPLDELIDPRFVSRLAAAHASGRVDATATLHSFLFLRQWLRRWP